MNTLSYPAIFHKAEEGGYWVSFPDFPGCFSEGDTLDEAQQMAVEALELYVEGMEKLPVPSDPYDINRNMGDCVRQVQLFGISK